MKGARKLQNLHLSDTRYPNILEVFQRVLLSGFHLEMQQVFYFIMLHVCYYLRNSFLTVCFHLPT